MNILTPVRIESPGLSGYVLAFFDAGSLDAKFRAYVTKGVSVVDLLLDAVSIAQLTANGIAVHGVMSVSDTLTLLNGATLNTAGTFTVSIPATFNAASTYASGSSLTIASGSSLSCAASATFSSTVTFSSRTTTTYTTSPANLTASKNNWNPAGIGTAVPTNIRVSANAGLSITGIIAGASGQRATIYNVGANAITLSHNSGLSSAGNKFLCPGSADLSLRANGAVDMWYDPTSAAWRLIAP